MVHQYKYLRTVHDDKLTIDTNVNLLCNTAHLRMDLYWKLCDFNVDSAFMRMFQVLFSLFFTNFSLTFTVGLECYCVRTGTNCLGLSGCATNCCYSPTRPY